MNSINDYVIISDGSCDLPDDLIKENEIIVIPFYISFDGKTYYKEKIDLDVPSFYQKIVKEPSIYPKTTMPSAADYYKVFLENVLNNKKIICVCITTKFSGSYNSAMIAKNQILELYPHAVIEVIDSQVNTGLQGIFVLELARMRKNNESFEDVVKVSEIMKKTGRIYFTVGSMDYLIRGGRVGKVAGIVGATLKIKPIIVLHDGEIFSEGISFTRKKSFIKAANLAIDYFNKQKENINEYQFITGYGYDLEEGKKFHDRFSEMINKEDVMFIQIGATIGVHTGPYPLGIGFIKKYEYILNKK